MRRRALSLAELVVAMSVFAVAVLATLAIEEMARRASSREDARTVVYRAVMLGVEHLRQELAGGLVVGVWPDRLGYRKPWRSAAGELVVTADGDAVWDPPDPDFAEITMTLQGEVVALVPGHAPRTLTRLGSEGQLLFVNEDPSRSDLVEIVLASTYTPPGHPERRAEFRTRFKVLFANQP